MMRIAAILVALLFIGSSGWVLWTQPYSTASLEFNGFWIVVGIGIGAWGVRRGNVDA
jgi:hypothetical protein